MRWVASKSPAAVESGASSERTRSHAGEGRPAIQQQNTRLLLLDDDAIVLEAMRAMLEASDDVLEVFTITDPRDLWEMLWEVAPELLVLDVHMPHIGGIELCRAVRSDPRWSHLSAIFVTSDISPQTVESLFAAGADDYLAKPLRGTEPSPGSQTGCSAPDCTADTQRPTA
jgi:CheY-like chemotaxis protein